MTRPNNPLAVQYEARLQEAIIAVGEKQQTCNSAALAFNVRRRTLYDRVNGNKKSRNKAHERDQLLSEAEEKELVQWITRLTVTGYAPRHTTLREMAEEIRKRRVKQINSDSMQLVKYDSIGKNWVHRFLRRHSELASITPRSIEASRVKDTSPERLTRWFEDLKSAVDEFNIQPKNMYNMDESGFAIGEVEPSRRIVNTKIREYFQAKPGRQEWVTAVECICADGSVLPPLIIFKAENLSRQWIPASVHDDWKFSCNAKGWTSNLHGIEWLQRCFEPATREKANGRYRLLICDGHDSHITGEWIAHCMYNNIVLMVLPPHSSHLTQPLDVGVFGPLKKCMATEIEPLLRTGVARVQKVEWLGAFIRAHSKAFRKENIKGGFLGTGIHPFKAEKVLNRVTSKSTLSASPRLSTPPIMATPFISTVLTSSPVNVDEVKEANIALNKLVASGNPLPTPAKNYLHCLTRSTERLHARTTILEREKEELQTVVNGRNKKRRLSGKRQVIDGKHRLTDAKTLKDIEVAEERTRQRKEPKAKRGQKRVRKAMIDKFEESEEELDITDDESEDILDCIEVAI